MGSEAIEQGPGAETVEQADEGEPARAEAGLAMSACLVKRIAEKGLDETTAELCEVEDCIIKLAALVARNYPRDCVNPDWPPQYKAD